MTDATPMVERAARVFRFGHYPRKNWGITAERFRAANPGLASVPINFHPVTLGHTGEAFDKAPNVLDGKLGEAVGFAEDGDYLTCTLRMHPLLDEAVREHGLLPSVIIGHARDADRLLKIDMVKNPHVKDVQVFADDEGVALTIEDGPDAVAFCDEGMGEMAQQFHDILGHRHPGLCRADGRHPEDTRAGHSARLLHDYAIREGGAYCPGMPGYHHDPGGEAVSMSDENLDEGRDEAEEPAGVREMREELARLRAELIQKDAQAFADEVCRGDNASAYPAERPHIVKRFAVAATDDARHRDTVAFADEAGKDATGTRVQAMRAEFAARPKLAVKERPNLAFSELAEEPEAADAKAAAEAREKRKAENKAFVQNFK